MLATLFCLLAAGAPQGGVPGVSNVVVSELSAGACSLGAPPHTLVTSASLRIAYAIGSPNPTDYTIRIFEDGVHVGDGGPTSFTRTLDQVRGGLYNAVAVSTIYRVDVVRNLDGVTVSSAASAPWSATYGDCAP